MIQKFAITLIAVFTLSACNQCNVNTGSYTSAGGSEQSTKLILSANESFVIEHEMWQPGHYEKRNITKISGAWSCSNNAIKLKGHHSTYNANLITIGENPLGLDANSKAIMFDDNTGVDFLNKEMFYPETSG